ncbi:protein-export chaperone SecB [Brevibacillus sp. GCM10020057]|uniref:protein-export chaperone SecB n=1 Tax=Brevibacillus sp. GCM10020057 TaxID=3317327 RepID=UPI003629A7DA
MDKSITSSFIFENYILNSINFEANPNFKFENPLEINFRVNVEVAINEENNVGIVTLHCKVFEDSLEKNYPFSLYVSLKGFFRSKESISNELFYEFCRVNGTTALFPFLRSAIADITKASNFEPLVLPLVNINNLISQE